MAVPARGHELSESMLRLFKDPDRRVSLGAMLIAYPVSDNDKMIEYARSSLKKNGPALERAVKSYYLARATYEPANILNFIAAFPEDPQDYVALLAFDASLTNTVSGMMIQYLLSLTECVERKEIREAARAKAGRLRETHYQSGWAAEIYPDDAFPICRD